MHAAPQKADNGHPLPTASQPRDTTGTNRISQRTATNQALVDAESRKATEQPAMRAHANGKFP
jgi:hypothetical protein